MALHVDDTLDLMQLAGQMDLKPGVAYTFAQVEARAHCTSDDAKATLHFLDYLGQVERVETPSGETHYRGLTQSPLHTQAFLLKRAG